MKTNMLWIPDFPLFSRKKTKKKRYYTYVQNLKPAHLFPNMLYGEKKRGGCLNKLKETNHSRYGVASRVGGET